MREKKHAKTIMIMLRIVSPQREATWLISESGLSSEFTSHGLYGEKVFQMTG